ncbi:HTH domain-containing protein [Candidatus Peregrinibacteria bacterium]|nr:MAG: HTH domain-containing protein [Candidatus Peregrinibacteria bacterium]
MLNKTDRTRIINQLIPFGCNTSETEIYIQSLQMGPASVQDIARKLKRNRVTVHSAIEQLIEKGLLFETRQGRKRLIVAEEPSILFRLLQKKKNELKLMEANLNYVTQILETVQAEDKGRPTIKLYEGLDGFKKMLEESLDNKSNKVYVFTYVDTFSKLIGADYLEDYFGRRAQKNITTQLIFPPCSFAKKVNQKATEYKIEVRLLPPELAWKSGFFSWDNKVALMSYTEGKLTCTIIENRDIAYFFQKVLLEIIWHQAKAIV